MQLAAGSVDHLKEIQHALERARQVHLEYLSASSGELTSRTVDPWTLIATVGHWYLIGWDHLRDDERMFRTDRIKSVEVLDAPAAVPEDFDPSPYQGAFVGRIGQRTFAIEISPGRQQVGSRTITRCPHPSSCPMGGRGWSYKLPIPAGRPASAPFSWARTFAPLVPGPSSREPKPWPRR